MKNYVQSGENITVAAPADVKSGDPIAVGSLVGVVAGDAKSGEPVTLVRRGVFTLEKTSAQAWTVGAKIYLTSGGNCTTAASGNTLIGVAVQAAADPSATGVVLLDGTAR